MEIERKWLVSGWPEKDFSLVQVQNMRQGYISVHPTVRIREESTIELENLESETNGSTDYILCFKSSGGLARKEIEIPVPEDTFRELEDLIGTDLIEKERRSYRLGGGLLLEVNHVDAGLPGEFWYAEVEYRTIAQAKEWDPSAFGLGEYLSNEVTEDPSQTMGAYWLRTRTKQA